MEKHKPLDAAVIVFLYLLTFISMGISVFSISAIFLDFISKYPSFANSGFAMNDLKYPIAGLIITAPLFIIFVNYIEKYIKNKRISLDSQIRKWLISINVFVFCFFIIIFLIYMIMLLLSVFHNIKIFFQLITVPLIGILVLLYNIFDIRLDSIEKRKIFNIVFNIVSIFLLILSLIISYILLSPASY